MFDIYLPSFADELAGIVRTKLASVPKDLVLEAAKDHRLSDHVSPDEDHYRHPIKDESGQVVGFFTPRESNGGIRTGAIYITPEARGKGYGSKALREYVGEKGARAFVNHDNESSQRMFHAAGFQKTDPEERWGGGHWWRTPAESRRKLTKVSFVTKTPTMRAKVQAEKHFENPDPNWKSFEKNLKKKTFQKAVETDPRADDKLKRYVENYGGSLTSKQVAAKVISKDSGQPYVIKELPGGRMACSCKNWQYRRSVDGGDCKHIAALVEGKMKTKTSLAHMVKKALRTGLLHDAVNSTVTTGWNMHRNSRQALLGQVGGEIARRAQESDYERRNRRR